jgi:leader peptidase (prepilin peptidase)/N-methyltransferase
MKAGHSMSETIILYIMIFLYGIVIGSFLNVCILRIPEGESIVTGRSHCDQCKKLIRWYDLIPIFSYIFLGGRCRYCKVKLSLQYPLIEALNGILYVLVFYFTGLNYIGVIYCLFISALIVLSVIDFRTNTIPFGINIFIFILGLIRLGMDYRNYVTYLIGFVVVSGFLYLIYILTKGNGMGGGDIKLMAAAGLVLGWKLIVLAFLLGCVYASLIHPIRMKLSKQGRVLAFGPYLAAGMVTGIFIGEQMISWYIKLL